VVPSYLAFVLRAGDVEPRVVDLGPADVLDASVATWKRNVASPGPESSYREAGIALRRLVWDPLQEAVGDAKRLFIVPDGALQLVNLAALPGDAGVYLVETAPLIHYLSSERDLVPLKGRVAGQGLLAVGAPQYDATGPFASLRYGATPPMVASKAVFRGKRAACGDIASARFEPLPQTGKETEGIVRLWEAHGNGAAVHLRQAEATETALKLSAPGHRVLHLATHGFFLGEECSAFEPARGVGGLVGASKVAVPPALAQGRGESPLLLSGLVLAGANHRNVARDDEDDGILTAEEIASLDLTRVEWAVLSACDTGVGEVRTGEGVFGMRRAFQIAGARTLILSLWSVEDDATRAWMAALYTARLQEGLDTAASVRAASLRVLETRKARKKSTHPFYWAAFVAAGGWE
jgi:CHAT domain-containing protein